jgi:hypothetical protein
MGRGKDPYTVIMLVDNWDPLLHLEVVTGYWGSKPKSEGKKLPTSGLDQGC